ncbi:hypothetical protein [Botrimarina colliarenosi]|uniref:hypothetical protein n=1 Tax=Botrimarina colliarenosi TaxID=2528001 RepID=UPI0011B78B19|nr:hypothetical protein [Botrimarina colliarenosi]
MQWLFGLTGAALVALAIWSAYQELEETHERNEELRKIIDQAVAAEQQLPNVSPLHQPAQN